MRLKDKHTGKIKKVLKIVVEKENGYGEVFTSIKNLNEGYEDVSEDIKPFEEVAKATSEVEMTMHYLEESATENERRGVGVRNPKHIKIADIDYYEILPDGTKKTEFTWDEAMEIEKKTNGKWRIPTQAEWFAIAAAFGADKDGEVTGETLAKNLNLTTDEDGYGYFWSSTVNGGTNARLLRFSSTYVNPQGNSHKVFGFTVRCVAR